MPKHTKLLVFGTGNSSPEGRIDGDWVWWVEVKNHEISHDELTKHMLTKECGRVFIRELYQYLPEVLQQPQLGEDGRYVYPPSKSLSGVWMVILPLSECPEPGKAEEVIAKHFPVIYALA